MTKAQVAQAMEKAGLRAGCALVRTKSGWGWDAGESLFVDKAVVVTRRHGIVWTGGIQLPRDIHGLSRVAKQAGETLFVVRESDAPADQRAASKLELIRNAIWWTRNEPSTWDRFVPIEHYRYRHRSHQSSKQGQAQLSGSIWASRLWFADDASDRSAWFRELSTSTGREIKPILLQRSGPHELVWFTHGQAVLQPAFHQLRAKFDKMCFTVHQGNRAIHARHGQDVVALVWPCTVPNPQTKAAAQRELLIRGKPPKNRKRLMIYLLTYLKAALDRGGAEELWQDVNGLVDALEGKKCVHVRISEGITEWQKCRAVELKESTYLFRGTSVPVINLFYAIERGNNITEFLAGNRSVKGDQARTVLEHLIVSLCS